MADSTAPDAPHIAAIEGGRPVPEQKPPPVNNSDFSLFGDFKSVVDLDPKVPHGRLQLGVSQQ